jgi:hypothetical protein
MEIECLMNGVDMDEDVFIWGVMRCLSYEEGRDNSDSS